MRFEWDEAKNERNIRKHGIDFEDAKDIFNHPYLSRLDEREDYGEPREVAIGWIRHLVGVVVYIERVDDVIRLISARKATRYEVKAYEKAIRN